MTKRALCLSLLSFVVASVAHAAGADRIELRPIAPPTCTSGYGCFYVSSSDNLLYTADAAGLVLKLHAAQSFRTSANCSALSSPVQGDVCYDTALMAFRFRDSTGWTTGATNGSLYVTLAGSQTITGAKTFNAAPVFAAGLTASGSTSNNFSGSSGAFLTSTGAVTIGPGATALTGNVTLTSGRTLLAGANTLIGSVSDKLNAAMLAIASQAVGDLLYANTSSTFSRLAAVASGSVLCSQGTGTAPAYCANGTLTGLYAAQWLGHASGSLTAGGTKYLMTGDSGGEANNPRSLHLSAVAMQALILSCTLQTEPGTGESVVFTVIKSTDRAASFSDTTLTCTIAGTANECTDSTNHPTTAQYDLLGVKIVNSNNGLFAASDAHCTVHMAR